MENLNYISLFDYLGRAAGKSLGADVFAAARDCGVKVEMKQVNHRGFNGKVCMYPTKFLQMYFDAQCVNESRYKDLGEFLDAGGFGKQDVEPFDPTKLTTPDMTDDELPF